MKRIILILITFLSLHASGQNYLIRCKVDCPEPPSTDIVYSRPTIENMEEGGALNDGIGSVTIVNTFSLNGSPESPMVGTYCTRHTYNIGGQAFEIRGNNTTMPDTWTAIGANDLTGYIVAGGTANAYEINFVTLADDFNLNLTLPIQLNTYAGSNHCTLDNTGLPESFNADNVDNTSFTCYMPVIAVTRTNNFSDPNNDGCDELNSVTATVSGTMLGTNTYAWSTTSVSGVNQVGASTTNPASLSFDVADFSDYNNGLKNDFLTRGQVDVMALGCTNSLYYSVANHSRNTACGWTQMGATFINSRDNLGTGAPNGAFVATQINPVSTWITGNAGRNAGNATQNDIWVQFNYLSIDPIISSEWEIVHVPSGAIVASGTQAPDVFYQADVDEADGSLGDLVQGDPYEVIMRVETASKPKVAGQFTYVHTQAITW